MDRINARKQKLINLAREAAASLDIYAHKIRTMDDVNASILMFNPTFLSEEVRLISDIMDCDRCPCSGLVCYDGQNAPKEPGGSGACRAAMMLYIESGDHNG